MRRTFWSAWVIVLLTLSLTRAQAGTITLPAGTKLHVVLETTLSTKLTKAGDPFRSRMVMPIFLNERQVVPMGTAVEGTVLSLQGPGRIKGRAEMQLRPEKLFLPDGRDISLAASLESAKTDSKDVKVDPKEGTVEGNGKEGINVKKLGKGAAMGAGVGAAVSGGMGAAMGAGAVGAIVVLHQLLKRGKDAVLPAGSELVLELTRPVFFVDMEEVPATPTHPPSRQAGMKQVDQQVPGPPVMQPPRELDQTQ